MRVSTTHEVTKLLEKALRKYAVIKETDVHDAIYKFIEELDSDFNAAEYGQSDDLQDKMALLETAMAEAEEEPDEDEVVVKEKDMDEEDNDDDDDDKDKVVDDDDDDTPDDDED